MIPHTLAGLAMLLMAATPASEGSQNVDPGRFDKGGSITLRLESLSGPACELTVRVDGEEVGKGQKSVALACGDRQAHRTLTPQETDDFLLLARDSQLYRARGIGGDGRAAHLWLATMKVTDGGRIVILVVSGNPEFASGPRQELVHFLSKLYIDLRDRLESSNRK